MSFQGLISGSECAAPSNPLSQVLKHSEGDRSLQQDRISGSSGSRLHHLPGSSSSIPANEHDLALARQFFEGNSSGHGMAPGLSMPHAPELGRMGDMGMGGRQADPWVMAQQHQIRQESANAGWANEFGQGAQQNMAGPGMQQAQSQRPELQQQQRSSFMTPMYGSGMGMGQYGMGMNMPSMQYGGMNMSQGKGKAREVDFEAAFAQFVDSQPQTSKIEEVDDQLEEIQKELSETKLDDSGKPLDYEEVWNQLKNKEKGDPTDDLAQWESEVSRLMHERDEEVTGDYGEEMQKAWESGNFEVPGGMKFDGEGIPILGEYVFEQNNRYNDPSSSRSLLNDAKALLEQNGSLSEAALMLEAAIQKGELGEGGYETWILLGETRNMDEREEAGMRALLEGVKRAEESGAAGAGMLSLAISFTNESYDRASHSMLLRWFRANYPEAQIPEETIKAMGTNGSWDTHQRITQLFLEQARVQHGQNKVDPDLQIALGVLFYTNSEYDHAQDCFASALNVRPKDYLLWNRLGSSMSNGNKPEEALGAYREALTLRPTYTRAIYNVGVACLNIGADKEAAEHFLSALSLQEATSGDTSDQLWFTLRRALQSMKRTDLAELAKPEAKANLDIFRREGFDF